MIKNDINEIQNNIDEIQNDNKKINTALTDVFQQLTTYDLKLATCDSTLSNFVKRINICQEFVLNSENYLKERETFIEQFVNQINSNVKVMQCYISRDAVKARMKQEISTRQVTTMLLTPWYKRFTKKQRQRILDKIRDEVTQEYQEELYTAEKNITEALNNANITTIKTENNQVNEDVGGH